MMSKDKYCNLAKYIELFANLNINANYSGGAPHKPIMLMAVMSLIDSGDIWENEIHPSEKLKAIFEALWLNYVSPKSKYSIAPWTPFWHLKNEPFWHFKTFDQSVDVDSIVPPGQTASIGYIREAIEYAYLDQELYEILQDKEVRAILSHLLVDLYLS